MPFPRHQHRSSFLSQLVQARYRAPEVRKLLDERVAAVARRRQPQSWLTGTHRGIFYRIRVPPPPCAPTPRLPRLPQLHTPTSPPIRFADAAATGAASSSTASCSSSATTATAALLLARPVRPNHANDFWESLYQWLRDNGPTLVLNFGSICTLIGFTRTDVLELRALSVTGSLCAVVYHLLLKPLRIPPIVWSLTFAGVNSYKIFEILVERQGSVNLTREQEERYIHFFMPHGVTPKQFELIQQQAQTLHVKKGTILIKHNDELKHVYLVVSGSTRASVLGRFVTAVSITHPTTTATTATTSAASPMEEWAGGRAECGAWIGEMSLLERVWLEEQGKQQQQKMNQPQPATPDSGNARAGGDKKESDDTTSKPQLVDRKQPTRHMTPNGNNQLNASHSMYTIVAAEDCIVLRWSHEDLQALMAKSTDMRAALTRAMTAAVVGKVIQFTVSRSKANTPAWSNWLQDWKHNAGASVQISTTGDQSEEEEEISPPSRENLPSYPIQRFR